MAFIPAPIGTACWTCGQPAQRVKSGIGACATHQLPNRETRRALAQAGAPAPVAAAAEAPADGATKEPAATLKFRAEAKARAAAKAAKGKGKGKAAPKVAKVEAPADGATPAQGAIARSWTVAPGASETTATRNCAMLHEGGKDLPGGEDHMVKITYYQNGLPLKRKPARGPRPNDTTTWGKGQAVPDSLINKLAKKAGQPHLAVAA